MRIFTQRIVRPILYDIKLRYRMLLALILLSAIPLTSFQFVVSDRIHQIVTRYVVFSAEQGFEQALSFINYKVKRISELSDVLLNPDTPNLGSNIFNILQNKMNNYTINQQFADNQLLSRYLVSFEDGTDVTKAKLYVNNEYFYSQEKLNLFGFQDAVNSQWYPRLLQEDGKQLWFPPDLLQEASNPDDSTISLGRLIRNPNNYTEIIGILRLDTLAVDIQNILSRANTVKGSLSFIVNKDNLFVSVSDPDLLLQSGLGITQSNGIVKPASFIRQYNYSPDWIVYHKDILNSDWTLVTVISKKEILSEGNSLRTMMITVLILLIGAIFFISFVLSRTLTRRISNIITRMKGVENGDLSSIVRVLGNDEISELGKTYNYMVEKMRLMHQEQYELGLEVKNSELKALQSQINPHFLYNTLDLINWMAQEGKIDEIRSTSKALAKFYRLTLNNGKDLIKLSDELQHIESYLMIQNTRFYNQLTLSIKIDDSITNCLIPKVTLQPIVENSVIHGILEKSTKKGTIEITGSLEGHNVIIIVKDDGVGMSAERLLQLNGGLPIEGRRESGYGLRNVDERLKLYFGSNFGLTFWSTYNEGTSVEIRIPLTYEDPEKDTINSPLRK